MSFSDYLVHKWMSELDGCWVSLHYEDPRVNGAYASEVTGGAYVRQQVQMRLPSSRATWNLSVISFAGLSDTLITHCGLWDASVHGNFMASASLPDPLRVIKGGRYDIPAESLAFSFDI